MPELPSERPRLPFEIDDRIDPTLVTAHAGVPLVIELFRRMGVAQSINAQVRIKQRQRGLAPAQLVETLLALWTAGGDRCQDLKTLRTDVALATLLGYELPAATTIRDFLEAFHGEHPPLWRTGEKTAIPEESAPLAGVGAANRRVLAAVQHQAPQRTATLDVDATILEAHKRTAAVTYEGSRGYQPVIVVWAEQDLIVHDEFRDGNVPAGCGNVRVLERAVASLPAGITQTFVRGDSALYEQEVLAWCEQPARRIGYAISADMSPPLHAEITRLPECAWQSDRDEPDVIREWAEVPYVPDDKDYRKDRPCVRRYLAVRVRKRQSDLFADGSTVKHFAIVTNREGDGLVLIRWHREKAGTVEHVHHVLKNELAAAALPSQKFGANAAWFRLNILTYNLLSALKRLALPRDLSEARPKRLRFLVFNTVGTVVHHARRTLLRLTSTVQQALMALARSKILALSSA
ncbi:MAG: IS1380 family transposase [Nitrospira sp.]|nr:IS1380 family transposase [Nitrospira sp.]